MQIFLQNCPLLSSENITKWISLVIIQLFKDNIALEGVNIDQTDKNLLKTIIYEISGRLEMKSLKSIINPLNTISFQDLADNFGCFYKVPSFLLDEEEARLSTLSLTSKDIPCRV